MLFFKEYVINFYAFQTTSLFGIRWRSIARCVDLEVTKFCSSKLLIGTSYTVIGTNGEQGEKTRLLNADVDSIRSLKNYHVARINRLIVDYAAVCLGSHSVCMRDDDTPNK